MENIALSADCPYLRSDDPEILCLIYSAIRFACFVPFQLWHPTAQDAHRNDKEQNR